MDGYLSRICPSTLIIFPIDYDCLVEELNTIEYQQKKQILLCTKRDEQGLSFLQLLNSGKITGYVILEYFAVKLRTDVILEYFCLSFNIYLDI